jgi:hypothetical protein
MSGLNAAARNAGRDCGPLAVRAVASWLMKLTTRAAMKMMWPAVSATFEPG